MNSFKYLIYLILLSIFSFSCKNEVYREGDYKYIEHLYSSDSTVVSVNTYKIFEKQINDTIIDLYYLANGKSDFKEDLPRGYRLVFSPFLNLSMNGIEENRGLCYLIDKKEIKFNNQIDEIYVFVMVVSEVDDDLENFIFYSPSYGFVASYSAIWGNMMVLSKLHDSKSNDNYERFYNKIIADKDFFPIPKKRFPNTLDVPK